MTSMVPTLTAMSPRSARLYSAQRGFTLIEALIAFVVLTVGILGIISLLIMSKSAMHQGLQRTRAINLADAIVERIRINPAGVETYNLGLAAPLGNGSIATQPSPDCNAASCDAVELAEHDLWTWEQALDGATETIGGEAAGGLINPRGCIMFTPTNDLVRSGMLQVIVQWQGLADSGDAAEGGDACGGEDAGDDPFRRQVIVNTLVLDETEFSGMTP
jgi:type IV pilus assembly protein PilV